MYAQYESEAANGDTPREATTYYYVRGAKWYRLYSVDFVTGDLERLAEYDHKDVAKQWLAMVANDPMASVPPTRPRIAGED